MVAFALTEEQFAADLARYADHPHMLIEISMPKALMLLAELQLALRHPGNKGPSADLAREVAKYLQLYVSITPALAEVCRRGWDLDEPIAKAPPAESPPPESPPAEPPPPGRQPGT